MISVGKAAAEMIPEVRRQFHEEKNQYGVTLLEIIQRACKGETIPENEDIEPDSDKCIMISTKSSVKEMLAPGIYAVLTPLIVGFLVGPRAVMGLLSGTIGSAAMLAVMMGNAGGAWDNAKKLCEKLKIKKTDMGKACIVGDTVGDPFKDTSGPSLDILLKLMAMVSLMIAPLISGGEDWDNWWLGAIVLVICIIATLVLWKTGVLTWKDPLNLDGVNAQAPEESPKPPKIPPDALREAAGSAPPASGENTVVKAATRATTPPAEGRAAWS
jgi:inorganic pyrophosphatase